MDNKYEVFIKLLNFNKDKYSPEKVFKDFVSLFAITLSNKVSYSQKNSNMYEKIFQNYEKEEQSNFYALSIELTRLFCHEKDPYDILGEIYQKITNQSYLNLKANNGKMIEMNCGSGAMILAYASTLKMFKLDYKFDLEVTAIDTDIINVFMTYIQLYFFEIGAVVILVDEKTNKELMRLYTPFYEDDMENLMAA